MDIQLSYEFIDDHMAKANGDFLKVYLYSLRHKEAAPSDEQIADALNMTEKDVQRAIAYWKKEGLLDDQLTRKEVDVAKLSEDVEFRALLHALQNYVGKRFTGNDAEILGYMYDQLGFSTDLIEYLFELCKQKGKTSLRYIEKVAQSWHSKGIRTVDDAKKDNSIFATEINAIKDNLGIGNRELAKPELDYIIRWLREWKMPAELVCEACKRTVLSTGKPSFAYADSIIKSWHEAGADSKEKVDQLDQVYPVQKSAPASQKTSASSNNKFHNFTERKTSDEGNDLDADVMDKFNDLFK